MSIDSWQDGWAKVIARAWTEPQFKAKLLANPKEALYECGVGYPEDCEVEVVENASSHKWVFALPPAPADLSEAKVAEAILSSQKTGISCSQKCGC